MCIILFRNRIEYTIYPSEIGKRHNGNNGLQVSSQNAIWNTREKNFKDQGNKKNCAQALLYDVQCPVVQGLEMMSRGTGRWSRLGFLSVLSSTPWKPATCPHGFISIKLVIMSVISVKANI